jgi:hypothetical protein
MRTSTFALAIPAFLFVASCSAPEFWVEPAYGSLSLDGDVRATSASSSTSADNSVDSLGLDDAEGVLVARADFDWLAPHLTVRATEVEFSGDGVLDAEISEGGVVIPASTPVTSDVELSLASAVLTFDLAPTDVLELGLGFGVAWIDFAAELRDPATGDTVDADEAVPVPMLAARVAGDVWRLRLEALASGLAFDAGDTSATLLDLDLGARMQLFGRSGERGGYLAVGWRSTSVDAETQHGSDEFEASLGLAGPYVGLAFGF